MRGGAHARAPAHLKFPRRHTHDTRTNEKHTLSAALLSPTSPPSDACLTNSSPRQRAAPCLNLVRIRREERRQQRDGEEREGSDTDDGSVRHDAIVGVLDLDGGLDRLRAQKKFGAASKGCGAHMSGRKVAETAQQAYPHVALAILIHGAAETAALGWRGGLGGANTGERRAAIREHHGGAAEHERLRRGEAESDESEERADHFVVCTRSRVRGADVPRHICEIK